jgi:hypothetical protein
LPHGWTMSSATSIDRERDVPAGEAEAPPKEAFRPAHFFVMASLILATIAVVMARQSSPANLILISLAIGAAGIAAAGVYRMLAPLVMADASAFRPRPSERIRETLEREKTLVLRSIKDLEFDRAMGKVSPRDFDAMAGRLRTRAMMLMTQLDEGGASYRELIERELTLRAARPAPPKVQTTDRTCTCGTVNDADAAFCKRCGTKLAS